jgi:hypothetical protein
MNALSQTEAHNAVLERQLKKLHQIEYINTSSGIRTSRLSNVKWKRM